MEFTALHVLWLLPIFTLTTQELVGLSVSPQITTDCGKQVTLQCRVSPSPTGLSIKHMEWSHSKTSFCSVNSEGNISYNSNTVRDFHCEFEEEQLSLIFHKVQPQQESGNSQRYRCKLHSNKGALHKYTTVELEDCARMVQGDLTSDGPSCTFDGVHPDGDVHWFQGSHNLSAGSIKQNTTKSVEKGGWLTIHSDLERKGSDGPYNCSLMSSKSGRYVASALIQSTQVWRMDTTRSHSQSPPNGVGSLGPMRILLCISVLLAVALK
ncbi:uncharacterized protein LOC117768025 [Hippoglossus hippoglossus]|uniref:uncharacterized protein LOC117768025 n=1 Tax=Hippoglossus hippoglossus TaxID=8267 RepID=UPI00148BEC9C|nr:uncharacterized protein LOC117768025 [Hippoglossus hippoglossus]